MPYSKSTQGRKKTGKKAMAPRPPRPPRKPKKGKKMMAGKKTRKC